MGGLGGVGCGLWCCCEQPRVVWEIDPGECPHAGEGGWAEWAGRLGGQVGGCVAESRTGCCRFGRTCARRWRRGLGGAVLVWMDGQSNDALISRYSNLATLSRPAPLPDHTPPPPHAPPTHHNLPHRASPTSTSCWPSPPPAPAPASSATRSSSSGSRWALLCER